MKRPGVERQWHHAVDNGPLFSHTVDANPLASQPSEAVKKAILSDVDQTLFYEEKIAPRLDEITRALSVGEITLTSVTVH